MNKDCRLTITPVNNGFMVAPDDGTDSYILLKRDVYVFQSFRELLLFLEEHLVFRCEALENDEAH